MCHIQVTNHWSGLIRSCAVVGLYATIIIVKMFLYNSRDLLGFLVLKTVNIKVRVFLDVM